MLVQFEQEKPSNFLVKGDMFMQNLLIGNTDYIQKKNTKIDANFAIYEPFAT